MHYGLKQCNYKDSKFSKVDEDDVDVPEGGPVGGGEGFTLPSSCEKYSIVPSPLCQGRRRSWSPL